MITFTRDQQVAIEGLINFIQSKWDENKISVALTGPAGTGKTFALRYVITNCGLSGSTITCCAPTHKACRVLGEAIGKRDIHTIQSVFGFRLTVDLDYFDPNKPLFKPVGKTRLGNTQLLIIDEASMLNSALVKYINNYCRKAEIKVIFTGDAKQLNPVNEKDIPAFKFVSKVFNLNQIVRQEKTNPISNLLTILRKDIENKTYKFFTEITKVPEKFDENNEGYCVVDTNHFAELVQYNFQSEDYTKDVALHKIVAYKNDRVNQWNNFVRKSIIGDISDIIDKNDLFMSYQTIVDKFNDTILLNSEEYIVHDIIDTIDNSYKFKGYLVRFQKIYGGEITPTMFIIDHKDKYTYQKYYQVLQNLINIANNASNANDKSNAWKAYFNFKKEYLTLNVVKDSMGKIIFDKDIDYGFAITSHKSQGSTYNNVYVDIKDMIYTNNGSLFKDTEDMLRRIYVACSRAKNKLILLYK